MFLFFNLLASALFAQQTSDASSSEASSASSPRGGYNEQFGVISERNMFVKDRVRGRGDGATSRPSTTQSAQSPLTPEESFILRGVVYENDAFTAYFENLGTSRIQAVNAGAELANTRIAEIALDAVMLERNGQTQWIVIGRDLSGNLARQATPPATGPGIIGTTSTPSTPSDPATLSIEERLRQRRQQERGGR